MRGFELVKREDHWALYNEDGHKIAATLPGCKSKLSIKNCESIANGYDLDELAREACDITDPLRLDSQKYKQDPYFKIGFNKGFQKALEILGDKKFSEEDMIYAYREGGNDGARCESMCDGYDNEENIQESIRYGDECREEFKKSLQQTEWNVEIITEPFFSVGDNFHDKYQTRPKLDADGCLILGRI